MSDYDDVLSAALADAEALEKRSHNELGDEDLNSIQKLSAEMIRLEDFIAEIEDILKKATEALVNIRENRLPDAMTKVEMKSFEMENGYKLSLSKKYIGSISKANEDAALKWFKDTKRHGVVTPNLTIPMDKGRLAEAEKYAARLTKAGIPVSLKPSVHWQTLRSVVRELYEAGDKIPDCISTHVINEAKIKRK